MTRRKIFGQLGCGWRIACAVFIVCAATAVSAGAQTLTTLMDFVGRNGEMPTAAPVQGLDGGLYGTTEGGGTNNAGVVYKLKSGKDTILYSFCSEPNCADGRGEPGALQVAGLVLATDGNFYGTTEGGGVHDGGTIFRITPMGTLTTLYRFCSLTNCADGAAPTGALVQAVDGNFYGTTSSGGVYGGGTVYRITPTGTFISLYSFCAQSGCLDGEQPLGALIQATGGDLYGTTYFGGNINEDCFPGIPGCGTVFKITLAGTLTTLYTFCLNPLNGYECTDGWGPTASLAQADDGNFYGTTADGGLYDNSCSDSLGCGTVFRITPQGVLTTLYTFCQQANCGDGARPVTAALVQATDGNLYGTTAQGGYSEESDGTIFQMTPAGQLTTLYRFCSQSGCTDGDYVDAGLIQDTDGSFYGTTWEGGAEKCNDSWGCGTIFRFDMGLGPFVSLVRPAARVGQQFGILGQGFVGTTSVSLNGTPASFAVRSNTLMIATVPVGATTGYVTVTTPTGVLTSNVPFYVLK